MKKIAVASGKGGTGKTSVSVMLARALGENHRVGIIDCDVENPNCHLFFGSGIEEKRDIEVFFPDINPEKCVYCGRCQEVCAFNSLIVLKDKVMFFPEMCHPCRGCLLACPAGAVGEGKRKVGELIILKETDGIRLVYGIMNVGEARSIPLIDSVKKESCAGADYIVLDCPPGAACPMVASVKGSDYVILVTEPTPFGLYDLKIAAEAVGKLGIPSGIVINRSGARDHMIEEYAAAAGMPVLLKIPFSRKFAEDYSRGSINTRAFEGLGVRINKMAEGL
ncbi:MAG: ATP-binding protein [Elusimicrobia bacterium]|nr:ATP-binding protein [Elusimicrobiota bacterium]